MDKKIASHVKLCCTNVSDNSHTNNADKNTINSHHFRSGFQLPSSIETGVLIEQVRRNETHLKATKYIAFGKKLSNLWIVITGNPLPLLCSLKLLTFLSIWLALLNYAKAPNS